MQQGYHAICGGEHPPIALRPGQNDTLSENLVLSADATPAARPDLSSDMVGAFQADDVPLNDNRAERWYVVHTQPRRERCAVSHLTRQGYRIFCPQIAKTIRHARKVVRGTAPLFPGYLFLGMDISRERWRSVNGTLGVIRLVMQGDAPVPLPRGVVEVLKDRTDANGAFDWAPSLRVGQAVEISAGPFADFVGTLESLDDHGRVRVLLDLLGRSVSVSLRRNVLMPVA